MLKLKKEEIGYIAGMIDGEGSICLHKCTWKNRQVSYYRPFVKVSNSNVEVLIWIKEKLGCGSIKVDRKATGNWKAMYTLNFSADMIRQFLSLIIDSLIIKKKQALLISEFLNISNRSVPKNFRINNEELYLYYYNEFKRLNSRGVDEKEPNSVEVLKKDNTEPSKTINRLGVCRDYVVPSTRDDIVPSA